MTQVSAKFQSPDDHVLEVTITATVKEWREIVKAIHGRYFFNPLEDIAVDVRKAFEQVEQAFTPPEKADDDGWIPWGGGECPVPTGTLVDLRFRHGAKRYGELAHNTPGKTGYAGPSYWENDGDVWDIVAYRIHDPDRDEVGA